MVLMDLLGNKIHATVKKSLIGTFLGVITEGSFKAISHFGVAANSDIIGEVVVVSDLITGDRNGKPSRRLTLEMQDCEEVKITVTLWDDYAPNVMDYFAGHPGGCVVMIIQFARIRPWRGTNTVTNSLFSTRLFIDSEIDEIMEYKSRIVNAYGTDDPIRAVPIRVVSYLSTPSSISEPNDFLTLNPKKRIDDLQEVDESCVAAVVASIVSIESEYGWFYIASKKCNKKVNPALEVGELDGADAPLQSYYYCNKCQNNILAVVPRFRVQIRVLDDSGSTSFLLFDTDVYKCIQKTALHVREDMLKIESEDERSKVPKELEGLVGSSSKSEYFVGQDVDADLDTSTTEKRNITPKCLAGKDSINSCTGEVDGHDVQLMSTATSPLKRTLQFDEDDVTLQSSSTKAKIEVKLENFRLA
ncbi:OLC1v1024543C1 [Oldenlandia corymbosa var. corymbosa]|uniref:OLC1v1024543C1 n=1 Tax=Oldenlandia corymbosa var. corymbosa TaxID=529605 RepID=A0AAV1C522_OLDCO|nr:OLC1v1024543C1 [Oldenlandia corymbosa var. corymbosa]